MFSAFGIISFLNPLFLLGTLFSGVLVFAYLKKKSLKNQSYSTLYLLKKLPQQILPKKKFHPPLRFFLELLALISLGFALANPVLNKPANKIALVFDTTLSMQAENANHLTRLDQAKKLAKNWLSENAMGSLISFYITAPALSLIEKEDLSYSEALSLIDKVEAGFSDDKAEEEIKELVKKKDYSKLVFVSDKKLTLEDKTLSQIFSTREDNKTKYISIFAGEELSNFYVQNLDLRKEDFSKNSQDLIASIGFAGKKAVTIEVEFYKIKQDSIKELIGKNNLVIYPNKINQAKITVERNGEAGKYQVVAKASSTEIIDSIQADNIAWLNSKSGGSEVLVVTDENKDLGLEKINYLDIKKISAEKFNTLSDTDLNKNALLIFYKLSPNKFPEKSSLFILPPEDNKLFPISAKVENAKVSSWLAEHSLTSYLKVPLINPGQSYVFNVLPWMKSIINSEEGAIILAGESRGLRFAALGFEIFPFEGAKTPALSVLTLNLINWLANTKELSKTANLYYPDESKTDEIKQISFLETQNLVLDKVKNSKVIYSWFIYFALILLFTELVLAIFYRQKNA